MTVIDVVGDRHDQSRTGFPTSRRSLQVVSALVDRPTRSSQEAEVGMK